MAMLPKTIYVKREEAEPNEFFLVASANLEDLLDKGEKTTVGVYKLQEYMVAGLTVVAEPLKKG